jgi:hypothetical protein
MGLAHRPVPSDRHPAANELAVQFTRRIQKFEMEEEPLRLKRPQRLEKATALVAPAFRSRA